MMTIQVIGYDARYRSIPDGLEMEMISLPYLREKQMLDDAMSFNQWFNQNGSGSTGLDSSSDNYRRQRRTVRPSKYKV